MSRPKLSVVTLTYNRAEMLTNCLASVEDSGAPKAAEFLIWDDASTDQTEEVCESWRQADRRIRYHRQPRNVGFHRNAADAFARVRGEYVCSMPDDDVSFPGNFEKKVALLDAHPEVGLVYSLAQWIGGGLVWRDEYTPYSYTGGRDEFGELICGNYIPGPSVVFRRSLMEQRGFLDQGLPNTLSDWDLWLRYTRNTQTAFIAEPLVGLRQHAGGMSSQQEGEMALGMIPVWRKWLVEGDQRIVIGSRTWRRMMEVFESELQRCSNGDQVKMARSRAKFDRLMQDYATRQDGLISVMAA